MKVGWFVRVLSASLPQALRDLHMVCVRAGRFSDQPLLYRVSVSSAGGSSKNMVSIDCGFLAASARILYTVA